MDYADFDLSFFELFTQYVYPHSGLCEPTRLTPYATFMLRPLLQLFLKSICLMKVVNKYLFLQSICLNCLKVSTYPYSLFV